MNMNMNEYDMTSIEVTFTHRQSGEKIKMMCPMVVGNMSITQSLSQNLSFQLNLEALCDISFEAARQAINDALEVQLEEIEKSFEINWE